MNIRLCAVIMSKNTEGVKRTRFTPSVFLLIITILQPLYPLDKAVFDHLQIRLR